VTTDSNGAYSVPLLLIGHYAVTIQSPNFKKFSRTNIELNVNDRLTLDAQAKNKFGDAMPVIQHRVDAATQARTPQTRQHFDQLFARMAKANDGRMGQVSALGYQDHPAGGCRMGTDPATSVVSSHGRAHDHENLFIVGSPTLPTGGCTNGTLTFVALALRSATEIARN